MTASGDVDETLPAPPRAPEDAFAVGKQVAGRYAIVRFIAAGGMGEVYEAEDLIVGTRVALKVVKATDPSDGAVKRLLREIALGRKVTHPNVCRLYDVGEHAGRVFLTMELLEGETLATRLKRGALARADFGRIAAQLVTGLAALHAEGIVHRDFKSANVIVVGDAAHPRVVVTDFGLARSAVLDGASSLTGDVGLIGTPAYMAPEQVEGRPATAASDLFALRVVLFEMATGTLPFHGDTALSLATARLTHDAPRASEQRPDLSPRWDAVIARCLERDPALRPASALEVLVPDRRRFGRVHLRLAGASMAAAAIVAVVIATGGRAPGRDPAEASAAEDAACPPAANKLTAVWDPATRARVAARFEASDQPFVTATWTIHARQLDAHAAAFAQHWDHACADRGDPLHEQRLACLEERLFDLRGATGALADPSIDVEAFALSSIGEFILVPPSACTSTALLRAQPALPPTSLRPAVAAVMTELHRLRFHLRQATNTGFAVNLDAVSAQMDDLARRARELGYPAGAGTITFWKGFWEQIATSLVELAEQTQDEALLVRGLALQWQNRARSSSPYDASAADAALQRAAEASARLGDPPFLRQWLDEARMRHHGRRHQLRQFAEANEALVAADTALGLASHALIDQRALVRVRAWNGELEIATADARTLLRKRETLSGPLNPTLGGELHSLSAVFDVANDPRAALALEERAIEIFQRAWRERPATYAADAHVLAAGYAGRLGDVAAVERHVEAAVRAEVNDGKSELAAHVSIIRLLRDHGHRHAAALVVERAGKVAGNAEDAAALADERRELAVEAGQPADGMADPRRAELQRVREQLARGRAAAALAALERVHEQGPELEWIDPRRGETEGLRGVAMVAAGDPAGALEHLERAIWIFGQCCMARSVTAQDVRLALARALWATGGDRDRARRLATMAQSALAGMGPALAEKARAADAWLAAHPR